NNPLNRDCTWGDADGSDQSGWKVDLLAVRPVRVELVVSRRRLCNQWRFRDGWAHHLQRKRGTGKRERHFQWSKPDDLRVKRLLQPGTGDLADGRAGGRRRLQQRTRKLQRIGLAEDAQQ